MSQQSKPEEPLSQSAAGEQLDAVDRMLLLEDEKNMKYRKRMLFLIPFNFFALFATVKYFQNIQGIAKRFFPKKTKRASVMNFFLIGTFQAMFFTGFYVGGNLLVLGINPIKALRGEDDMVGHEIGIDSIAVDKSFIMLGEVANLSNQPGFSQWIFLPYINSDKLSQLNLGTRTVQRRSRYIYIYRRKIKLGTPAGVESAPRMRYIILSKGCIPGLDGQPIDKAAAQSNNMRVSDMLVLKMFKTMGLSENTMAQIESDLRVTQQEATKKQLEAKAEQNAGK